jgi:RNA polymerase sigma factor (sigma-70 family)
MNLQRSSPGAPVEETDATLLARSRADSAAFRVLYDRHAPRIHAFLLRRTGDDDAAFALTAETFSAAWLSRARFVDRGEGALPWLFGIARHVLASSVRGEAIEARSRRLLGMAIPLDQAGDSASPRESWLAGLDGDLAAALADLPAAQRAAIELRVLDDASYSDIGRELGTTPGAARVRVHRALGALRATLRAGSTPVTTNGDRT